MFSVDISCLLPITGPMVWYQKFEYAVGHWLQKTAQHVFGSVLCSPGCFSLFRASALMDDNVLKRYTTTATRASEYIQYDQGIHREKRLSSDFFTLPFLKSFDAFYMHYRSFQFGFGFQGKIAGFALFYCSKAGALNTVRHQMHTPIHHKSSKNFTTKGGDGDHLHWLIHWTFCTGYCNSLHCLKRNIINLVQFNMYMVSILRHVHCAFCDAVVCRSANNSGPETVKRNSSISRPYNFYQMFTFGSSILGPASVTLMIAGKYQILFFVSL